MKNVLFICENFIGGGLETRIAEQIHYYKKKRIRSYLVCNRFNNVYNNLFDDVLMNIEMFPNENITNDYKLLENMKKVIEFAKKHKIDFIDCHPFWSSIYGSLCSDILNIPAVYTLHGTLSCKFYEYLENKDDKSLVNDILLYGFDNKNIVAEYLLEDNKKYLNDYYVARNGVKRVFKSVGINKTYNWAIVSRLDEPKSKLIKDALSILKKSRIKHIDIYGDGDSVNYLKESIVKNDMEDFVTIIGWKDNIRKELYRKKYDAMIGMGRTVIESQSINLPTMILGYGGLIGMLCEENFEKVLKTNYTSFSTCSEEIVLKSIDDFYLDESKYKLKKVISKYSSSNKIWKNYYNYYKNIKHNKHAINQMYQKIIDNLT